ncbi:MAG: ParB/RepB/Spo0J family partition protein [Rhodobacterales bacterium]|jgi:ParB family chromosome partitioning protein|tara:strand:- start:3042 stop:3938 length:897 start_codon:yes stop_codon:yes gene_type:complete
MSEKKTKKRGLGRGLSALMSDVTQEITPHVDQALRRADFFVPVEQVQPNPDQPRRAFDDAALQELATSIAEKGVIQPLIVREHPTRTGIYEIVAGERRWRASQIAQLHDIPVIVRQYTDTEVLEVAIIENIQRADLNPIDEGAGYRQLMQKFGHTQEQLSSVLGKSRSHIANVIRLLSLPDGVRAYLVDGKLTAGHARTLIGHDDAQRLADHIVKTGMSVRDAEKLAKQGLTKAKTTKTINSVTGKDADTVQIEGELSAALGMKVSIDHASGTEGGRLSVSYRNLDQLDDLLRALSGG